nr:DUF5067 domain-containing protein [Lysinibacillus parviboronicapiens]
MFSTALVLSLGLAGCGSDTAKEEKPKEETKAPVSSDKIDKEVYFKDNEAKLESLKIKINETKVIKPGEKGNEHGEKPVFAIWFEATNLIDDGITPSDAWFVVFTVIQDNNPNAINELEVGALPDERFLETQLEKIKKDGTVEHAIAYELDDLETPVTLVANQGIGGKELGKQEYQIKQ